MAGSHLYGGAESLTSSKEPIEQLSELISTARQVANEKIATLQEELG